MVIHTYIQSGHQPSTPVLAAISAIVQHPDDLIRGNLPITFNEICGELKRGKALAIAGPRAQHIICESMKQSTMQWKHANFVQPGESKTQVFAGNILDYCLNATRIFWQRIRKFA
jgi:hypothetical protein